MRDHDANYMFGVRDAASASQLVTRYCSGTLQLLYLCQPKCAARDRHAAISTVLLCLNVPVLGNAGSAKAAPSTTRLAGIHGPTRDEQRCHSRPRRPATNHLRGELELHSITGARYHRTDAYRSGQQPQHECGRGLLWIHPAVYGSGVHSRRRRIRGTPTWQREAGMIPPRELHTLLATKAPIKRIVAFVQ